MSDKMDQALLKAAVGLLKRCEPKLLQMQDMEDALHLLKLELPGAAVCMGGRPCMRRCAVMCWVCVLQRKRDWVWACGGACCAVLCWVRPAQAP